MLEGKWMIIEVTAVPGLRKDETLLIERNRDGSYSLSGPANWERSTGFSIGADQVLAGAARARDSSGTGSTISLPLRLKVKADGKLDACLGGGCKLDDELAGQGTGHDGPGFTGAWMGEGGGAV